nr:MAG TPA: replication initiator protein [Caudoviricetes sp.]
MSTKNWDVCDQLNYQFVPVPRALARGFKDLSINAKWAYSLMLDRMMMSRQNIDRFHDKNGMFLLFNRSELAEVIGTSESTVKRIFAELKGEGLIETKAQGFGKPQKIYLRKLSELASAKETYSTHGSSRRVKLNHQAGQIEPSDGSSVTRLDGPPVTRPIVSNTYMSNTYKSKTESSRSSRSNIAVNGSVGKTTPTPTQSNFGISVVTPTLEKIRAFVEKNNFTFSPEKFYDYYNAVGWKVRGMPITDWQSLCRSWQARERPAETKHDIPHIKGYFEMTEEEREAARRRQAERNGNGRTGESAYCGTDGDLPF